MTWIRGMARQLRALLRKERVEREMDEEFAFHLEMETAQRIRDGMSPAEARRAALLAFGGVERFQEEVRVSRWTRGIEDLGGDVRYAARTLRRYPVFAAAIVVTLALGIGGTTAVFSVVRAVLLEPLPYERPGALVRLYHYDLDEPAELGFVSGAHFLAYRETAASFEQLAALYTYSETGGDLLVGDRPERIRVLPVTSGYFDVLRRAPLRGRTFTREEEDGAPHAILSEALWRRLGAERLPVGASIELDARRLTIVGIMPGDFADPIAGRVDVWVPQELRSDGARHPDNHFLTVIGRLANGVTPDRARAEMSALDLTLAERWPEASETRFHLVPLHEDLVAGARPTLLLLSGAVGIVLLIACVNVANLLLVRSLSRARELAVRAALGAGRARLVRQLVVEGVMLAVAGGVLGIGVALIGIDVLLALGREATPRAGEVGLDVAVLGFAAAVTMLVGFACGLAPALRASRAQAAPALRDSSRSASQGLGVVRARGALVAAQVALALMLLVGATVLAASMYRLARVDLGVRTSHALTFQLNLPAGRYDASRRVAFHREMTERLGRLAGTRSAAAVSRLPATGQYHSWGTSARTGPLAETEDGFTPGQQRVIEGDYFATLGIPLIEGRTFDARDHAGATPVAVVSERIARALFPGMSSLGQRIRAGGAEREIVGVVADVALDHEGGAGGFVYHAHAQFAENRNWALTYIVSAERDAASLVPAVRRAVSAVDPQLVVHEPALLDDVLEQGRSRRRFAFVLTTSFAALALALAVVGLYGTLAHAVAERTREIAIRLALGARPAQVAAIVLRQGMLLTAAGIALGLAGALALGRVLASLVFRTEPGDPAVIAGAVAILAIAAIAAMLVPTWRALRVPPRTALGEG